MSAVGFVRFLMNGNKGTLENILDGHRRAEYLSSNPYIVLCHMPTTCTPLYRHEWFYSSLQWRHNDGVLNHPMMVYSTVYSDADQWKHQSSASLAGNLPVVGEFPHKRPVTQKMLPFDDVIMISWHNVTILMYVVSAHIFHNSNLMQNHLAPGGITVQLTCWGRDKMDAISQTTFSSAFSWMKMFEFQSRYHWSLFLKVQLTIFQHWFR